MIRLTAQTDRSRTAPRGASFVAERLDARGGTVARARDGRIVAAGIHRTRVSEMRLVASRQTVRRPVVPGAGRRDERTCQERNGEMPGSPGGG